MRTDKPFIRGVAATLGVLIRTHDLPTTAIDILLGLGFDTEDLAKAGVDAFDLDPIRKALEESPFKPWEKNS